jgi:hypothetical protein
VREVSEEEPGLVRGWLEAVPRGAWVPVTGAAAGLVVVGLVWLSGRGCEVTRDTPNCGAFGLPLLVLAVGVAIVAGYQVLRRLRFPRAGLTAFLGVCFMAVVVLALLSDRLSNVWSVLVVPTITSGTFVLAHLLAGRLGESTG